MVHAYELDGPDPIWNPLRLMKVMQQANDDQIGWMMGMTEEYGDILLVELLGQKVLLVSNPDYFQEILVTKAKSFQKGMDYKDSKRGLARFVGNGILVSDGEFWRKQRKLVAPAFHVMRIRDYAETMAQFSEDAVNRWHDNAQLDIADEMMRLTLRIVAQTLFSLDLQGDADVETVGSTMEEMNKQSVATSFLPTWVPTRSELSSRKALRDMDELVYSIIAERRKDLHDNGDLLSMLLLAEDDEGNRMSDKQVRDEAVTLFLAGHETTANAINWTFWLLAQNPDAEAKLHEELDTVLQGRTPTLEDLKQLPYTEMVIKESMRLMPPVTGVGRETIEDVQIGDVFIPQGTEIGLFFYRIHRDARYWNDPLAFKPERFHPEYGEDYHKYAYLPFGAGMRVCVGFSFAMMEAQLLLATIAQRFSLSLIEGHVVKPVSRITMYPEGGLPMIAHARERVLEPEMA